jgi:uncharacterized membrane protein
MLRQLGSGTSPSRRGASALLGLTEPGLTPATARGRPPSYAVAILWLTVVTLSLIGVTAAIGRSLFLADFATRADPVRTLVLQSLRVRDPFHESRAVELARFDSRFAAHRAPALLHVVPGGLFLALAPFQFSSRIRRRHVRFHRWSGRILVLAAVVSGATGLFFGLFLPFGGVGESAAIAVFGGLFLLAVVCGFVAIRRRQITRHREWMIRGFAVAIAISTVRVVAALLDVALTPAGFAPAEIFVISLWTGWLATVGGAEAWIRFTRSRADKNAADTLPGGDVSASFSGQH